MYCTLKARFGTWSPTFLRFVRDYYSNQVPHRFTSLVAKLERERPWDKVAAIEHARTAHTGLPPTITLVRRDGSVIARWRPTAEEWQDAAAGRR